MRTIPRIAGAAAYAVAACLFFLLLKFPAGDLADWLAARINASGALSVTFKEASAGLFPPGVRIEGVEISTGPGTPVLSVPMVRAGLSPSALFRGRLGLDLTFPAYGGEAEATLLGASWFTGAPPETDLRLEGADLSKLPPALSPAQSPGGSTADAAPAGRLSLEVSFASPSPDAPAQGEGVLRIEGAQIGVSDAAFAVKRLDLGEVEAAFSIKGGELQFSKLAFKSARASGSLSGTARLYPDPSRTALALSGEWKIDPADVKMNAIANAQAIKALRQRAALPLRLAGTFAAPQYSYY